MMLAEQPGDREDRQGHPFVGPAGRLLDRALTEAKIPRDEVYITNAVKHFRWIQRGKRRLHQNSARWVLGGAVAIGRERGTFFAGEPGPVVFVTVHPSSIFRQREEAERQEEY